MNVGRFRCVFILRLSTVNEMTDMRTAQTHAHAGSVNNTGTTTNSQPGVGGGWEGWGFRPDVICLRRRIRLVRLCVVVA